MKHPNPYSEESLRFFYCIGGALAINH